jgi:hypothetical protein
VIEKVGKVRSASASLSKELVLYPASLGKVSHRVLRKVHGCGVRGISYGKGISYGIEVRC